MNNDGFQFPISYIIVILTYNLRTKRETERECLFLYAGARIYVKSFEILFKPS